MEYHNYSWERHHPLTAGAALTAADIAVITRLLLELRELTQSRSSYAAASEILHRLGSPVDSDALVRPEKLAH